MSKRLVKLSSHALSDYQRCPKLFWYSIMRRIEPRTYNRAFDRGTVMTNMLEAYYNDLRDKQFVPTDILRYIETFVEASELADEDKALIARVFMQYFQHYKNDIIQPVVCELPFSFVLYEDDKFIFIYEGSIDMVFKTPMRRNCLDVMDHKTYSVKSEIYAFNNQAQGYCYAMKTDMFVYNYIGLTQTKKPKDNFERKIKQFTKIQLEQWRDETIKWFKRIADDEDYLKSLRCETKYGLCRMTRLCECTSSGAAEALIKIHYQENEHASWGKDRVVVKVEEV